MRTRVLTTALGQVIVIHPSSLGNGGWDVVAADKNGNWKGLSTHTTKEKAQQSRTEIFTYHRRLRKLEKHNV